MVFITALVFYFIGRYSVIGFDRLGLKVDRKVKDLNRLKTAQSKDELPVGRLIRPDAEELRKRTEDKELLKEFDKLGL